MGELPFSGSNNWELEGGFELEQDVPTTDASTGLWVIRETYSDPVSLVSLTGRESERLVDRLNRIVDEK